MIPTTAGEMPSERGLPPAGDTVPPNIYVARPLEMLVFRMAHGLRRRTRLASTPLRGPTLEMSTLALPAALGCKTGVTWRSATTQDTSVLIRVTSTGLSGMTKVLATTILRHRQSGPATVKLVVIVAGAGIEGSMAGIEIDTAPGRDPIPGSDHPLALQLYMALIPTPSLSCRIWSMNFWEWRGRRRRSRHGNRR